MAPTGRNRFAFDAATLIQAENSAALTASGVSSYFDLGKATSEWHLGDLGAKQEFVVVVHVGNNPTTGGATLETYSLALQVANDDASVTEKFSATAIAEAGVYVLPITKEQIETVAGASKIAVSATLAGTAPSIQYFAYVAPFYGTGH